MPTTVPNPCDQLEVDLSRIDLDVEIQSAPCIDVEITQTDITIDSVSVAGQGPPGQAATIQVGTTTTTAPGGAASVMNSGTTHAAIFDFGIPTGSGGPPGPPGTHGDAATVDAGSTTTLTPGTPATVTNAGSTSAAIFNFGIPQGISGPMGHSLTPKGSVLTHSALPATGNTVGDVYVTLDTQHSWGWDGTTWVDMGSLAGPPGTSGGDGLPGPPGAAATIAVGSTATGTPGSAANVTNSGSSSAAVFNFTVPAGVAGSPGTAGTAGTAATATAGTTITGAPGTSANVVNAGTTSAAVFNFTIPRGDTGAASTIPGPAGPSTPSANTGNLLTTGSDSLLYLPPSAIDPEIWSVRLRSFNSVGNSTFEVDQRTVGTGITLATGSTSGWAQDRWFVTKSGTMTATAQQLAALSLPDGVIPGMNFRISRSLLRVTVTTTQASLGANDYFAIQQFVEGPNFRELQNDVHSISLLVRSSVAGLKFGISLRDPPAATKTLTKLCTIPTANTWALVALPGLPVWPSGNFSYTPGLQGYLFQITLAAGTTVTSPANDTWQAGGYQGAVGQSNLFSSAVNSTVDFCMIQHEPGPVCSTFIDKPFTQNYDECLRFYQKTWNYTTAVGNVTSAGSLYATGMSSQSLFQPITFLKPMAKAPTAISYSPVTGAANIVRDINASAEKTAAPWATSEKNISGWSITAANAAAYIAQFHYTADTGW